MVLPRMIHSAKQNKDIVVYGDGKQTRCFAHIFDIIEAINLIAFAENTIGKVINVGNNNEISIMQCYLKIKDIFENELKKIFNIKNSIFLLLLYCSIISIEEINVFFNNLLNIYVNSILMALKIFLK